VLELKGARKAYGSNVVLGHVDLMVERGERIALVGPNGAGKSTLMRLLAGEDRPDSGTRQTGHQVVADYFAQDQAAALNPARTVYEEMSSASPSTMVPMIRTILGGFLFSGDDVYKKVAVLSGGERNRLALARMLLSPSNLLLLDEPTNHLDLDSKEVLLNALADYAGTLVFVSHDRYFVDKLASKVIEIGGGEALVYPGGYEDFLHWRKQRELGLAVELPKARPLAEPPAKPAAASPGPAREPRARAAKPAAAAAQAPPAARDPLAPRLRAKGAPPERAVRERELKQRKARISDLEGRISEKEKAVKELEQRMASPGFYDDRAVAERAAAEHAALMWEVGDLMGQWEALQAELETGS
jgi:ATP-binding cassette subfamily F protein 3